MSEGKFTPGPWHKSRQPGGGWIAVRINFAAPGNSERLPQIGEYPTEARADAAIASFELDADSNVACCRSTPCRHPGVGPCDMPAKATGSTS